MASDTDSALLRGLLAQDPLALEQFDRVYRARIFAVARGIVADEWEAEEVVQDTLWTVFRRIESFRGEAEIWTWVYRITVNAARMSLRRSRRAPRAWEPSELSFVIDANNHETEEPAQQVEAAATQQRLGEVLATLDPLDRELFEALELRGEERSRVAQHLGLSLSAVKSRLYRTRRALRQICGLCEPA